MYSVTYQKIRRSDLIQLFGISRIVLERWIKAGLPCELDAQFMLTKVLRWRENYFREQARQKVLLSRVTQQDLARLFNVSRQTIVNWGRTGLPRNQDGSYSLQQVVCWLREFYKQIAEREYRSQLAALRKKLCRNVRQLEKFFEK